MIRPPVKNFNTFDGIFLAVLDDALRAERLPPQLLCRRCVFLEAVGLLRAAEPLRLLALLRENGRTEAELRRQGFPAGKLRNAIGELAGRGHLLHVGTTLIVLEKEAR